MDPSIDTTRTAQVWDAEDCPDPIPDGYDACMIYVGGSSAAHVWTDEELARVAHLPRLPVWVPTPGQDNARAVALEVKERLRVLGVPRYRQDTGERVAVMWDLERGTLPDPGWVRTVCNHLAADGWSNLIYGSTSWVFQEPPRDGYVVATNDGINEVYPHAHAVANQYRFDLEVPGGTIDVSCFNRDTLARFWHPKV